MKNSQNYLKNTRKTDKINKFRIIGERGRARKERNREEFTKLSKEYKKKQTRRLKKNSTRSCQQRLRP